MRGPFQVHRLFLHSCPPPIPPLIPPFPIPQATQHNAGTGARARWMMRDMGEEGVGEGVFRRGVAVIQPCPGGRFSTLVGVGGGGGGGGMGNLGNPPDTPTPPTGPHQNDLLQGKRDLLKGLEV